MRKKAINYYRENLQGTSVFNAEIGKIDIDKNGIINFTRPVYITLIKRNNSNINFRNINWADKTENTPVNSTAPVSSDEALGIPSVGVSSNENISHNEGYSNIQFSINKYYKKNVLSIFKKFFWINFFDFCKCSLERHTSNIDNATMNIN